MPWRLSPLPAYPVLGLKSDRKERAATGFKDILRARALSMEVRRRELLGERDASLRIGVRDWSVPKPRREELGEPEPDCGNSTEPLSPLFAAFA
jgi:hypothetical protein